MVALPLGSPQTTRPRVLAAHLCHHAPNHRSAPSRLSHCIFNSGTSPLPPPRYFVLDATVQLNWAIPLAYPSAGPYADGLTQGYLE